MTERSSGRLSVLGDTWRTQLWPIPALSVLLAVVLGIGLPRLDSRLGGNLPRAVADYLFSGDPQAARTMLSVVAGSLITATSLIFSLTVVALQLASSQYSPRLLRTFAGDRVVHATLAVLLGTFTYTLTVLRTIRDAVDGRGGQVPQVSVTLVYLLALASVMALVGFLAHVTRQIRVETILRDVHAESSGTLRRTLGAEPSPVPADLPVPPGYGTTLVCGHGSGFLTSIDEAELLAAAVDLGAVVVLDCSPGDSLIAGTPIATAWPASGRVLLDDPEELIRRTAAAVHTGIERTAAQDPSFGLRQIVDVAVRALSPGINDPTTAVHALGHACALLVEAAGRNTNSKLLRDDEGVVRVVLPRPDFAALLAVAVDQPRRYGAQEPHVLVRLYALLREVAWVASRPEQRQAVADQLLRLDATADRPDREPTDRMRLRELSRAVREALDGRWVTAAR
ncbi:DUF2254 domain-containing protein [Streptomyces sp. NPDC006879]|uniref:DUF2254 domain-containing protein n=1 Tax=Streptomyces sp. NPDC006879 TaxID=3364767 RepID=UPI00369C1879